MVAAQGFVQLVNSAFVLIILIYMEKQLYPDYEAAMYFKYRFAGVLLLSFPLGMFIKGRRLKPFFLTGTIGLPIFSLIMIEAINYHVDWLVAVSHICWGVSYMLVQVNMLPFILRNSKKENHTEAISLSYSMWSLTSILGGLFIFGSMKLFPEFMDERRVLEAIAIISAFGVIFVLRMRHKEHTNPSDGRHGTFSLRQFEWGKVTKAMVPTILIATGAGMTIPFISLFFFHIHGVDSDGFAIISVAATVIVFVAVMLVPAIRRRFGFKLAIPLTQSMSILMLVGLASTEFYSAWWLAMPLAIFFYCFRQPLMNLAGPMTSEFTMMYVGKQNEEIVSALTASIWSGSWFISGLFFQFMRSHDVEYSMIFLITAGLYCLGVISYVLLLHDYYRREEVKENTTS